MKKRKVGILGFGATGKFLVDQILNNEKVAQQMELSFIWNRSAQNFCNGGVDHLAHLCYSGEDLESHLKTQFAKEIPDIIVEVAHPNILKNTAALILENCSLYVGSVTAFANKNTENILKQGAKKNAIYIPAGASWGINDIAKLAALNKINALEIAMKFNANALKLNAPLNKKLDAFKTQNSENEICLFSGNVRELATLAPNNVNTMCALALATGNLGLDHSIGHLYAKKGDDFHEVTINVKGENGFNVSTSRINPAKKGAVTGQATYFSFLSSLLAAKGFENGLHFV